MELRILNTTVIYTPHRYIIEVEFQHATLEMTNFVYVATLQLNLMSFSRMNEHSILTMIRSLKCQTIDRHDHHKVHCTLCKVPMHIIFKASIRLSESQVKISGASSLKVTMAIPNIYKNEKNIIRKLWHL